MALVGIVETEIFWQKIGSSKKIVAKKKCSKFEAGLKGDVDLSRVVFFSYVLRWVVVKERFILKISCAKATINILLTDKSIM